MYATIYRSFQDNSYYFNYNETLIQNIFDIFSVNPALKNTRFIIVKIQHYGYNNDQNSTSYSFIRIATNNNYEFNASYLVLRNGEAYEGRNNFILFRNYDYDNNSTSLNVSIILEGGRIVNPYIRGRFIGIP